MKMLMCCTTLLLLPVLAAAADVSGKWRGSASVQMPDGQSMVVPVSAEFKQQDKSLTGTTGKDGEEQYAIERGKIEEGNLSFEFTAPEEDEPSGKRTYTMRLKIVSDAKLDGEFEAMANGTKMVGKVMLTRTK